MRPDPRQVIMSPSVVAALVVLFVGSRIAQARPNPTSLLRVLPQRSHVISGSTVPLKAVIENHFHVPLWVGNQDTPNAVRFWLAPDSRGPEGNIAATLQRTNVLTSMWYVSASAVIVVSPLAKAWLYPRKARTWRFSLCGRDGVACYQHIEGDDSDRIEPNSRRFYLCGKCVQDKVVPHGRLYMHADDVL